MNLKRNYRIVWEKIKYPLFAFLIAFIPRIILVFGVYPLRTVTDEMITIAGGAYFAGLDWSHVLSFSERYYGSGFTILFSWIFKLTDNPVIIYRILLIGCSLTQAIVAPICWHIFTHYFKIKNRWYACIASVVCSYCVVTRATIVYNEHVLILISWLIAWLLIKLSKSDLNKKQRITTSVLLVLVLMYSLTVHTRSYTYWIALVGIVVLFLWRYRKMLVSVPVLICSMFGALAILELLELLKRNMYLMQEGGSLTNTTVSLNGAQGLLSASTWEAWLDILIGQVNTISFVTGGFIALGFVLGIVLLWNCVKRKSALKDLYQEIDVEKYYWLLLAFFGAAIIMTIIAQSFSWLSAVSDELNGVGDGSGYGYKAFTYVRYFGPYCGPVVMVILAFIYQYREKTKIILNYTMWFLMGLQIYWVAVIVPVIYNNKYPMEAILPLSKWAFSVTPQIRTYLIPVVLMWLILGISQILYYKKKLVLLVILLASFLGYQYVYNAIEYDYAFGRNSNYEESQEVYHFVKEMEQSVELPENIYVYDGRDITNQQIFYEYQFLLNRYKVIPGLPEKHIERGIIISNVQLEDMEQYELIEFESATYMYVRGIEL